MGMSIEHHDIIGSTSSKDNCFESAESSSQFPVI